VKTEKEVLRSSMQIISAAINVLQKAILPDGMNAETALSELCGIFDCDETLQTIADATEIFVSKGA
jgi:hypothetical protein